MSIALRSSERNSYVEDCINSTTRQVEMEDPPIEKAVASPGVEIFGVHELVLNLKSKSGYKDVYPVQRKKRPWQAKVWDESRRTHLCLGSFTSEKEAAVAVAVASSRCRWVPMRAVLSAG